MWISIFSPAFAFLILPNSYWTHFEVLHKYKSTIINPKGEAELKSKM